MLVMLFISMLLFGLLLDVVLLIDMLSYVDGCHRLVRYAVNKYVVVWFLAGCYAVDWYVDGWYVVG